MADPIPTADAGLLAAQAKAGQAGVDAYNAAISTLQQQRQQAVQQAMQEAALRGAPAGAAESQQSIITGPYDQRIASLTQSRGGYQADLAARDRRMTDYNAAVQGARSYIPQQVELAVAPIRAQGEYAVRQQQIRGDQTVAEINANRELTLAKMAAAVQAAEIAAAKEAAKKKAEENKLNQGELQALLSSGAQGLIQEKLGGANQAIAANEFDIGRNVATQAKSQAKTLAAAKNVQSAVRNQTFWDLLGARYTGNAIQSDMQQRQQTVQQQAAAAQVPSYTQAGFPGMGDIRGGAAQLFPMPNQQAPAGAAPGVAPGAVGPPNYSAARSQITSLANRATQQIGGLRDQGVDLSTNFGSMFLRNLFGNIANQYSAHSSVNKAGQRILMNPQQVGELDPFAYSALMGAPSPIRGTESFNRVIMGQAAPPGSRYDTGGVADPYSSDVLRTALEQSSEGLSQDYNITYPQVANAMSGMQGKSIRDFLAGQGGGQTNEDAYAMAQAAGVAGTKQAEASSKAAEDAADVFWQSNYGRSFPSDLGSAQQAMAIVQDPATAPLFEQMNADVADALQNWDNETEGGDPNRTKLMRKIKALYTSNGRPFEPLLFEYALAANGM